MNINYFIQQNLIWISGIVFYFMVLKQTKLFLVSRLLLLSIILLGIFLPLYQLPLPGLSNYITFELPKLTLSTQTNSSNVILQENQFSWILIVYLLGLVITACIFLLRLIKLFKLIRKHRRVRDKHHIIIYNSSIETPFSFFRYIFFPEVLEIDSIDKKMILKHESIHQKSYHSLDVLFLEICKIFFWYNPLIYFIKSILTTLHEYETDSMVLQSFSKEEYTSALFKFNVPHISYNNVHYFSSQLKNRLHMINNNALSKLKITHILALIPFLFLLLTINKCSPAKVSNQAPIHAVNIDTIEVFDPSTHMEEIKIVKSEYDYYNQVSQMPYLKSCAEQTVKNRSDCSVQNIKENLLKNLNVEKLPLNTKLAAKISLITNEEGNSTELNITAPNENFKTALYNSFNSSKFHWIPGKLDNKEVKVHLVIPIEYIRK